MAGDQQAATFGQVLLLARYGENTLRHRLFPLDEYGRRADRVAASAS